MVYNFEELTMNNEDFLGEFMSKYSTCIDLYKDGRLQKVSDFYQKIFEILSSSFREEVILKQFEMFTKYKISLEVPYGIWINEIYNLKSMIISHIVEQKLNISIINFLKLFKNISNNIAHLYLIEYLDKLLSLNDIRRHSLSDLNEKNLIIHYESHLIWLSDLAQHIKRNSTNKFPELNHTLCTFGTWLHGDAKKIIQNNSKYKDLQIIHEKLHQFAKKIYDIVEDGEYNILITYLEKCEMISLTIGTELALLDQILMNKKISKDYLTGAFNRQSLEDLFENQYDLALASNNHFVLAMCDLDYFKSINDTYGHVAGDYVLKLFVHIVQKNIRNSDMIIRYGGEEFVIMLPTIDKKNAHKVLNKIREEFEQTPLEFEGKQIKTTVSMGMMEIRPEHLYNHNFLDEYIMIVDKNLYIAKESGRNRIEMY